MNGRASSKGPGTLHVSLVALPDAVVSTLAGIYDVMNAAALMGLAGPDAQPPFRIETVGESTGPLRPRGRPVQAHLTLHCPTAMQSLDVERGRREGQLGWCGATTTSMRCSSLTSV